LSHEDQYHRIRISTLKKRVIKTKKNHFSLELRLCSRKNPQGLEIRLARKQLKNRSSDKALPTLATKPS
jgi:hypothetical protein